MDLKDLLNREGLDPGTVIVFRHRPTEPELNKVLPWLADQDADLFNAYQQTQGERVEKAMLRANYVASFVRHGAGRALFVGLYRIGQNRPLSHEDYWQVPAYAKLKAFGMTGALTESRPTVLWFDLAITSFYSEWKGKL